MFDNVVFNKKTVLAAQTLVAHDMRVGGMELGHGKAYFKALRENLAGTYYDVTSSNAAHLTETGLNGLTRIFEGSNSEAAHVAAHRGEYAEMLGVSASQVVLA